MDVENLPPQSSSKNYPLDELVEEEEEELTPAQSGSKGLNIRPFLRLFWRRWYIIAGCTGLAIVAILLLTVKKSALYKSTFRLLVEPVTSEAKLTEPSAVTRSGNLPNDPMMFQLDYATQIQILTDTQMLSKILEDVRVRYPKVTRPQLEEGLLVVRVGDGTESIDNKTKLLEVSYQDKNPEMVQFIAETIAYRYLKYSLEERKTRLSQGLKFIEDRLPKLQQEVAILQTEMQKLQEQNDLSDPKQKNDQLYQQNKDLTTLQLETDRQLKESKELYANLQQQLNLSGEQALAASALSENSSYQQLVAKAKEIDRQIATESSRFQADSPQIQALRQQRQNIQQLIEAEQVKILGSRVDNLGANTAVLENQNPTRLALIKQLVDTDNQIKILEVRSRQVNENRQKVDQEIKKVPAISRQYNDLQRQLELTTKTLDQLLSQRQTLQIEAAQNEVPWELVSQPQIETDAKGNLVPVVSDKKKKLLQGVVGSLLLGLILAFLIDKSRNIFYENADIKDTLSLPLLGEIPHSALIAGSLEDTREKDTHDKFIDAFETLYANLRFLFTDRPVRSLTITSATMGDGKSTVALNLAKTAAAMGHRVLLVDADFRFPRQHLLLDLPNQKGLTDLLSSNQPAQNLIHRPLGMDNFSVLTSGQALSHSIRQLASAKMQSLSKEFASQYDLIIYDTPHLLDTMDANFLAENTDGILLVVAAKKTPVSDAKKVMKQLTTYNIPCLGAVGNRIKNPKKILTPVKS